MVEAAGIERGISEKLATVPDDFLWSEAHGKDAPTHPLLSNQT
jgi:hypothetical protein